MLRLQLRLDRIKSPVWICAIAAMVLVSAVSVSELYPDRASIEGYARLVGDNAAVVVQAGPGYGLEDHPSAGTVLMNEASLWTILLAGLMSIMLVTRHTRSEEESERAELLRSAPVGRHAAGVATMLNALLVNAVLAVVLVVGLAPLGYGVTGSLAFALAVLASGLLFAAIALVSAQVASTGRAATGMSLAVVAVAFMLRAVGDVTGNGLSWLSPIGIGQAMRPFADERWWTAVLSLGLAAAFTWVASVLATRRDFGAGMLVQRAGRPGASRWLTGPVALAFRLHRGAFSGWLAGLTLFALFYGGFASEAEQMLADNPDLDAFFAQVSGSSITDAFLASAVLILALILAGYGISGVLRLSGEESGGRVESLLATPTPRTRWASSHLVVTLAGVVVAASLGGLALGAGAAVTTDEARYVTEMLWAFLAFVPAVGLLGAVAFALWAWLPRFALLAWLGLVWAGVAGMLGGLLDLPEWTMWLSVFEHVPAMPAEGFDAVPLVVLAAAAASFVVLGMWGFARRDLTTT